jgi:uncharacterized protein DUF4157
MNNRARLIAKTRDAKREKSLPIRCKSNISQSTNSPIDHILSLQKTIGNQEVQRLFKSGVIQAKLRIGEPGDIYEQEADRVAEQVIRMPEPALQRQAEEEEEEEELIQTKPLAEQITPLAQRQVEEEEEELIQPKENSSGTVEVTPSIESSINSLRGGGQPLPESTRRYFEPRFRYDFSQVKIHAGSETVQMTRKLNAEAFTYGRDIYFGAGKYNPGTSSGKRLLAHELTHLVQQGGQHDKLPTTVGLVPGNRLGTTKSIRQTPVQVIHRQEGPIPKTVEPIPKTAEEVVAGGEQKVRDQAGRIIDKYQALMRRYAGALLTFKATLDAPSSKEVQPQIGKVLIDYATDKVIGKVAEKIPGASYVYDIYKEIQKENKRVEAASTMKQVADFFKKHNKWVTVMASNLERRETEAEMQAVKVYRSWPSVDEKAKYWLQLRLKADSLDLHLDQMTQNRIFILFSEKWIAESKVKVYAGFVSGYIEIKLDKNWKVVKAHIHAPRGQTIADEFSDMKGGVNPLSLRARKIVRAEGYTLTSPVSGKPFLFQAQLGPSNEFTYGNKELFDDIKRKGVPATNKWTGD